MAKMEDIVVNLDLSNLKKVFERPAYTGRGLC